MLDVIELVASAGDARLRFSDVVSALDLTQATAHAILKTLCDRGWLIRDPATLTFVLGPGLAVVAARTEAARPLAHAARIAAQELSQQLGHAASVLERVADELVITAFEGAGPRPSGTPGDRIRYAPPFGVAFAAWDSAAEQRAWIGRAPTAGEALTERLVEVLAQTRARGFDVDWTTPELTRAAQMVGSLSSDGLPDHVRGITDQLLAEFTTIGLAPAGDAVGKSQPVATIAAPVFDPQGRVALILCVHPLRPMTARQVDTAGQRVRRAADRLSRR
ncbi:helix-turn-helix domain-containing protein [Mycobacterium sp. TNTM28]|uniref:Helix-turn-helix domain-containing protein n=1 Tax=[Mycobacterium] fortunisiensis TaxID=2600579 RepID=A0ABS6KUQ5_9MYCO|nr:helix-turn-helix domain-containing protein [[Mycobacterium] fortunisiensis]MBU9767308.1 helix-turn-helix domain-containing protein [[Mycobacterium] fortunisiensis]